MQQIPLSYIIIGLTTVVSIAGFSKPELNQKLLMNPYRLSRTGEYYRFLTSGFVHGGYMHLIFNMFTFFFFATNLENMLVNLKGSFVGSAWFLLIYLGGIVISDLPTFRQYKDLPHYSSLGASGGVSAVLLASVLYNPLNNICLYGFLCLPGFILAAMYLVYSYVQSKESKDNINHSAHFYGALFGFALAAAAYPASVRLFFEEIMSWRIF